MCVYNDADWPVMLNVGRGSAALRNLNNGPDLLDTFEVNNLVLLQKGLKDLVHCRGLEVQQNLCFWLNILALTFAVKLWEISEYM